MSKPFLTTDGYAFLKQELDHLWLEVRPQVTAKVSWAASLGDRSENADYQYNKRLLMSIDRRIRFLRHLLNDMQVIEYNPQQAGRVFFGAYVEIEADDDDGTLMQVRIVGTHEICGRDNYISVDSPMARAMLGKSEGDEAVVQTPKGNKVWFINRISYKKPEWFTEIPPHFVNFSFSEEQEGEDGAEVVAEELTPEELKKIEQSYLSTMVK